MKRFKTADEFFASETMYPGELARLREIILATELHETVKWGAPVYTIEGKNVAGIGSFKSYFGIWFFQGAFLKDAEKVLINAQEGKTKGMRQWRFESGNEINKKLILKYLREAIANSKAGKEIKPEKKSLNLPAELKSAFSEDLELRDAFEKITPGKQREYAEYISDAKREATKAARLEKIRPMIKAKIGLNDKYK